MTSPISPLYLTVIIRSPGEWFALYLCVSAYRERSRQDRRPGAPKGDLPPREKLSREGFDIRRRLPFTGIMPPAMIEPPDSEVLDGNPFMRGEWPDSIALDVGFSQVAEALGDGAPLPSVTPETLLAVAFSASESSRLLKITPMEFVSEWEAAIDERAGLEDVGAATETAYLTALAAANTAA